MATLTPSPYMQFFDTDGTFLAGGKLYTYAAGTTTPQATYTTQAGTTENTNPVTLDTTGSAAVWLGTSLYYFELKDSAGNLIWTADNIGTSLPTLPTRTIYTSGSGTYSTPTGARQLRIRIKGGGGGSAGGADSANNATDGGTGGTTSFNSITAIGGSPSLKGAASTSPIGGIGGTGGSGTASKRIAGAPGGPPTVMYASGTNAAVYGGQGGGQGGGVAKNAAGTAGAANTGGGASGGCPTSSAAFASMSALGVAGGGGEGEYAEIIISSPAANYSYSVGAGGTAGAAGTNGTAGAIGGSGYIIIDEYY